MQIQFKVGDIVDEPTEALISTGNVQLSMSGGVNGELLLRGGDAMQRQLHQYLRENGLHHVEPGFVMEIGPAPTRFRCVVYTVAVDGMYGSSVDLVARCLTRALDLIAAKGCMSVAIPALATGYGPLRIKQFINALHQSMTSRTWPFTTIHLVLRNEHDMQDARAAYEALL